MVVAEPRKRFKPQKITSCIVCNTSRMSKSDAGCVVIDDWKQSILNRTQKPHTSRSRREISRNVSLESGCFGFLKSQKTWKTAALNSKNSKK